MLVRMLDTITGPGNIYRAGEEHDVPTEIAKAWVKNGQAQPITAKRVERAERRARVS